MSKERRLQWKIAWSKLVCHFCTDFWRLVVAVIFLSVATMGVKIKREYTRDYIPFEKVLKKNFLLQEEVLQVSQKLSDALDIVSEKEKFIDELTQRLRVTEHEVQGARDDLQVFIAKVDTFEELVKSLEIGKQKNKNVIQENITLAVKLRESENEIRVLREKLKEIKVNNDAVLSIENCPMSHDVIESHSRKVTQVQDDHKNLITQADEEEQIVVESKLKETVKSDEIQSGTYYVDVINNEPNNECTAEENSSVMSEDESSSTTSEEVSCGNSSYEDSDKYEDTDSEQSEVDMSHYNDFTDDDGIKYMFISGTSMTRHYILLSEDEDENWFPKKKVYDEFRKFVNCQHKIHGRSNCAERRADLNTILDEFKKGVKEKDINDDFLNGAFMMIYETIEGVL